MSFFIKDKFKNGVKRKFGTKSKFNKTTKSSKKNHSQEEKDHSIFSDLESDTEYKNTPDIESEDEHETPQEKKLRLAKKYLEEIEKEEKSRDEHFDDSVISKRLKEDYLEQTGRLRKSVADSYTGFNVHEITTLKCREHSLTVTCLCISWDNNYLFSGSKDSAIIKWSIKEKRKIISLPYKPDCSKNKFDGHSTIIMSLAISHDNTFLAVGDRTNDIQIYNPSTLEHLHTFKGHRGPVTGLVFRKDTHQLYSVSEDRLVKVWSVDEMTYVETMFGHQSSITAIDAPSKERAVTAGGRDNSLRLWKIAEESQLIFNGHTGSIDAVKLINEDHFISSGEDGLLCIWGTMKKKPLCFVEAAHGRDPLGEANWLSSVSALWNTDLIASGSRDGFIRLWKIGDNYKSLKQILEIPVDGFINALCFTSDGSTLIAAVGQEHRLGRWWRNKTAKNSLLIIPLTTKV